MNGDPETVAAVKVRVAVWIELVCPTLIERLGEVCALAERTAKRKQAKRATRSILTKALHSEQNLTAPVGVSLQGRGPMVSYMKVKSDIRRACNSTIPCNPDYTYRHCADLQIVVNPDNTIDGRFPNQGKQ